MSVVLFCPTGIRKLPVEYKLEWAGKETSVGNIIAISTLYAQIITCGRERDHPNAIGPKVTEILEYCQEKKLIHKWEFNFNWLVVFFSEDRHTGMDILNPAIAQRELDRLDIIKSKVTSEGQNGAYGSNNLGYINSNVRIAAHNIRNAIDLYCFGHYRHSNAKDIPDDHPLCIALAALAQQDKDTCMYANLKHDPELFTVPKTTEAEKTLWDNFEGMKSPSEPQLCRASSEISEMEIDLGGIAQKTNNTPTVGVHDKLFKLNIRNLCWSEFKIQLNNTQLAQLAQIVVYADDKILESGTDWFVEDDMEGKKVVMAKKATNVTVTFTWLN